MCENKSWKVCVRSDLLYKDVRLSSAELDEVIRVHTEGGYLISEVLGLGNNISDEIRYHHENATSENCRPNITVADSVAVMIIGRFYQQCKSAFEAKQELIDCSGSQFAPDAVDLALKCMEFDGGKIIDRMRRYHGCVEDSLLHHLE